jgi:hypothetical protein
MVKTSFEQCKYNTILEYLVDKILNDNKNYEKNFFDECFNNIFFIKIFLIKLSNTILEDGIDIFKNYYQVFVK